MLVNRKNPKTSIGVRTELIMGISVHILFLFLLEFVTGGGIKQNIDTALEPRCDTTTFGRVKVLWHAAKKHVS